MSNAASVDCSYHDYDDHAVCHMAALLATASCMDYSHAL